MAVRDKTAGESEAIRDKSAGGGEVWSLERYELEKQTKLLINPPEELKSGRSRGMSSRSRRNC